MALLVSREQTALLRFNPIWQMVFMFRTMVKFVHETLREGTWIDSVEE